MPDAPTPAETGGTAPPPPPEEDTVALTCIGSFHEFPNMTGRLLQSGDTFSTERSRAVELRANGLVSYSDPQAEEEAAKSDPPPPPEGAITTRSMGRRK